MIIINYDESEDSQKYYVSTTSNVAYFETEKEAIAYAEGYKTALFECLPTPLKGNVKIIIQNNTKDDL